MATIWCFYHLSDFDGKCSAAIVYNHFSGNVKLVPVERNTGDNIPWDLITSDDIIYIVDFSFSISDMVTLGSKCKSLIWIDHHISVINEYYKHQDIHIDGLRDPDLAACQLTFKFLYPYEKMPAIIELLGNYDIWNHFDTRVVPFQYGMEVYNNGNNEPDDPMWKDFIDPKWYAYYIIDELVSIGEEIQKYISIQNERIVKAISYTHSWEGLTCLMVNRSHVSSHLFESVANPETHDIAVAYSYNNKNKYWVVSLRQIKKDIDVSLIAKKYGGGGHTGASGFATNDISMFIS